MTGVCRMNLRKYPMDTQKCVLNIMSCKLMAYVCMYAIRQNGNITKKKYCICRCVSFLVCILVVLMNFVLSFLTSIRFLFGNRC